MPKSYPGGRLPFMSPAPPMQAREVRELPSGEDWIYELQWRGEYVRAAKRDGGVHLMARDGKELTNRFPRVAASVAKLRSTDALLDGEILHLDAYSVDALCFLTQGADDMSTSRLAFLASDLLCDEGRDVRHLSLLCRRLLLVAGVQATPIVLSPLVPATADGALALAAQFGLAGVVAKRAGSSYRPNSLSHDWVKVTLAPPAGARRAVAAGHSRLAGAHRGPGGLGAPLSVS